MAEQTLAEAAKQKIDSGAVRLGGGPISPQDVVTGSLGLRTPSTVVPPVEQSLAANLKGMEQGLAADIQTGQARAEQLRQEVDQLRAERTGLIDRFTGFFTNRQSSEEILRQEQSKLGIIADFERNRVLADEIGSANRQIANLEEAKVNAIEAAGGRAQQQGAYEGAVARIEKSFNSRINAASAKAGALATELEVRRGNIDQARAIAGDVLNAVTADQKAELDEINTFYALNQDMISDLNTDLKSTLDNVRQDKRTQYEATRQKYEQVLEFMITYPDAGISLEDTVEQATAKAKTSAGIDLELRRAAQRAQIAAANSQTDSSGFTQKERGEIVAAADDRLAQVAAGTLTEQQAIQDLVFTYGPEVLNMEVVKQRFPSVVQGGDTTIEAGSPASTFNLPSAEQVGRDVRNFPGRVRDFQRQQLERAQNRANDGTPSPLTSFFRGLFGS